MTSSQLANDLTTFFGHRKNRPRGLIVRFMNPAHTITIFGPIKERDGTWRIKTNEELNKLIGNKTIINYIKSQRLGWLGHVHRKPDERMVKKKSV